MPIARRKFQSVGQNGTLEILVSTKGGHVLSADMGVATLTTSLLLAQTTQSFSDASWTLPIAFGVNVPILNPAPGQPAQAPLPWIGNGPDGFLPMRLAMTVRSGTGQPERNLSAEVFVSINGARAKPVPLAAMVFPSGPSPTADLSRTTVVELIFQR